jgi:hypothetical protein
MRKPLPIPARLQGTSFHVTNRPVDVSEWRARGRDIQRPYVGVRAIGVDLADLGRRCAAYAQRMPSGHAFSHTTAALLYRVPLPRSVEVEVGIHVSAVDGSQPPRTSGVIGHRADVPTRFFRDVRVVSPAEAWVQLAQTLTHYDLIAAGDFLVSGRVLEFGREPAFCTLDELHAAVDRNTGRRGVRACALALPRISERVDSPMESYLRLILVDAGFTEPVVNEPVFEHGERIGKPDLAYPLARVVIDYEGDGHRTNAKMFKRDIVRRERFESQQYRYLRVVSDDLFAHRKEFLSRVARVLRQQGVSHPESAIYVVPEHL